MRTYSRDDWEAAQAAWSQGRYSREWRDVRHVMAMQGVIYPPTGDRHDSWEDDSPSQRAILIRAIRETPVLLGRCVRGAQSWSEVIGRLLDERDEWREDLEARERVVRAEQLEARPRSYEAPQTLAAILERVAASRGIEP